MLAMMPTANDIDEAKEQFIYVSSVGPIEELKASHDRACGNYASEPTARPESAPATAPDVANGATEESKSTETLESTPANAPATMPQPTARGSDGDSGSEVSGIPLSFVSVNAGNAHTCGVRTEASVVCWSVDEYGQATPPQ